MIFIPPQDITALRVTSTATATSLYELMDTAGSLPLNASQKYYTDKGANALIISAEDGDIRWLVGGTPTATIGTIIKQGASIPIAGVDISQLQIISTAGSVSVNVQLYKSEPGEGLSLGSGGGADASDNSDQFNDEYLTAAVPNATPAVLYVDMRGFQKLNWHLFRNSGTDTFTVSIEVSYDGVDASATWIFATTQAFDLITGSLTNAHVAALAHYTKNAIPVGVRVTITTAGGVNNSVFRFKYNLSK